MKTRLSGLVLALVCALPGAFAAPLPDVLNQPAIQGPQALRAVLQDVTRAGERLVAVGERGVVLLSDDNGAQWRQAKVPVRSTLTAVQFLDAHQGWAVGHAGVVLHSADGGETWRLQLEGIRAAELEHQAATRAGDAVRLAAAERLVADGADKPFLALHFSDPRHGLVIGAYGLAMHTSDGGNSWQSWMDRLPNPQGLHLYALAQHGSALYLAGEQGLLLRSSDGGAHFDTLESPYEGSYFSVVVLPNGRLLVGGLRGKLFASDDQGDSFQLLPLQPPVSLSELNVFGRQLLLVNQAGIVLRSALDAFLPRPLPLPPGPPLTAVTEAADGSLIAVGLTGPLRLPSMSATPQSGAE